MESVFQISGCAIENQVKFATCTLLDAALTWWNSQIRSLGPDAYVMTWEVLKKKMTDKYCPWLMKLKRLTSTSVDFMITFLEASGLPNLRRWMRLLSWPMTVWIRNSAPLRKGRLTTKGRLMINPETTMAINNNPPRDIMLPRSTIWYQVKDNHMGETCPSAPSAIFTIMARVLRSATSATRAFQNRLSNFKEYECGNVNAQGWVYAVGNAEKKLNASSDLDSNVVT
nr:reverse transcriptase domain-containing protein [Tanacetum cinerariifolium]